MTTGVLCPTPILRFCDNAGNPLVGGQVLTQVGGVNTATYSDVGLTTPLPNPIILNSRGEIATSAGPSAQCFLTPNTVYTFTLSDANGNQINVSTYVNGVQINQAIIGGLLWPQTAAEIAAGVTPVNYAYQPGWAPRYGVIGTGAVDDTQAMENLLACSNYAVVPFGFTPLISSTLTIAAHCCLEFQGGYGNANGALPGSYLKMASSLTAHAVTLLSGSTMRGGGIVGTTANTGGGVVIAGNGAELYHPFVQGTGGDGIRVGDAAGDNCNSFRLVKPISIGNSGKGISIHDGTASPAANVNAGQIDSPFATSNGSHGIYLGRCFWVTVINPLAESNTGYGVYLDGANDGGGVPICRYPTIIGGDANEGNTAGQWFDQSYFGIFINPDGNNVPSTAVGALPGSGERTILCARDTQTYGLTVNSLNGTEPLTVNDGTASGMTYPAQIVKTTGANNGDGAGFAVELSAVQAGSIRWQQVASSEYNFVLAAYKTSAAVDILIGNVNTSAVTPATDNAWSCGSSALRWSVVYAATGTINTSDAASKTEIEPLSAKEQAVAKRLKGLIRSFKFKDAVAKKGDGARLHIGVLAQDVESAFAAEGLDVERYGMFCRDATPDGPLSGVRYEELLAFVVSAL